MTTDTRDNLQARNFLSRRMRAALLEGDAESDARPLARLGLASYAGIFVTIALLAAFGIVGVLKPGGSTAWQEPGAFIVAEETGARFVYLDGVLHPVLNYSSARLLLGEGLHVVTVSARSLESAARGTGIGIPMAPDSLPDAANIVGRDWSVCAIGHAADGEQLRTAVFPGRSVQGEPIGGQDGYLVQTAGGRTSLIWSGHAYEIPSEWLGTLGFADADADAVPVGEDFVAALPPGQQLAPVALQGIGEPGPPLPGSVLPEVIGSIYADRVNSFYVMTRDGLAALTPLQADLLLGDPRLLPAYSSGEPSPLPISQAQVTDATLVPLPGLGEGQEAPARLPPLDELPPGEQQLCVRYSDQSVPDVVVGPADPDELPAAGLVQLAADTGALIASRPDPDDPGTTVYLVTDTGVRYPVADQKTLELLGLAGVGIAQLPPSVVELLPQGPLLDPAAAARPAV